MIITLIFSLCLNLSLGEVSPVVTPYKVKTDKTKASFRAAVLSDLHNSEFGRDNRNLIETVKRQKPDVIFTLGDFVNRSSDEKAVAINAHRELVKICPVYAVFGNHENGFPDKEGYKKELSALGVHILDNSMESFKIQNEEIIIGGLSAYPFYEYYTPDYNSPQGRFLDSFTAAQENRFCILLNHFPEYVYWGMRKYKFDLMLCGHTHGGIVRLPFVGGLLAPNQGIFSGKESLPLYTKGEYNVDTTRFIITSGLGNSRPLPRYNNPPEIMIIDIN